MQYWIDQGVRIFRVDNPHTKPFLFWKWLIADLKRESMSGHHFPAEAFTRPKVMYHLAKLGFTQSYTYFAWRDTKTELTSILPSCPEPECGNISGPNLVDQYT